MERKFWLYIIALVVLISIAHTMAYNDEVMMEDMMREAQSPSSEAAAARSSQSHPQQANARLIADRL